MSSPNSPQNAASPLLCGYRLAAQPPSLEQQAQNLVSAMEYWDTEARIGRLKSSRRIEQLENLSRLYRCAWRRCAWRRYVLGYYEPLYLPSWVDDYSTYP